MMGRMTTASFDDLGHLPPMPRRLDRGIGLVGAGFIARDCHLPSYAEAGFRVVGIHSRTRSTADEVARLRGIRHVRDSIEELVGDPEVEIVDVAIPPAEQPEVIRRILAASGNVLGILAQKPLALELSEATGLVEACEAAGVRLQVNQNMRYDHSVRALRTLLDRGDLGTPVLATIEMRAVPHWMPWARGGRSLSTLIMSIHHLDTFRYWLGEPSRVLASTRPDPRTKFAHNDGINLYILEYANGARASAWDDVWAGPEPEVGIRWRFEGTAGIALGTIGWPGWPERVPSTIDSRTSAGPGGWQRPRWPEAWFPDAFAGPMAGLMVAIEDDAEPDISGRDNLNTLALCEAVLAAARGPGVVDLAPVGRGMP